MTIGGRVGVLGGTFDPIHYGHLDAAGAAQRALDLDTVLLVPSRVPPHRDVAPVASEYDRFAMSALAADSRAGLMACDLELRSSGPSYTAVTLDRLVQQGIEPTRLFFITGADAFLEIATWHDYPAVLDRSHFVVVSRPGHPVEALRGRLPTLASRIRNSKDATPEDGATPAVWLVDALTADVASSVLRRDLSGGRSIDKRVPPAVARYIATHRLYVSTPPAKDLHD